MVNLKLLQLGHVQISGSYENFPEKIRWLCWQAFPFESIPRYFPLEALVALEMPYSSLKHFLARTKFLKFLKILNLSHSRSLAKTPDFIVLLNLERLVLEDCTRLVEIHESVGHLGRLILLNLKDCSNLRKLPRSIGRLKSLETLDISGCSNLENLPTEMGNMDSLTVLQAENVTGITQSPPTIRNVKAWYSFLWLLPLKAKRNPETSWASSLPRSLVKLSLVCCNLSDGAFPRDMGNLSSLRELNLSNIPITTLPDWISVITGLEILCVNWCTRLQSLVVLQDVLDLSFWHCSSFEKITLLSPTFKKLWPPRVHGLLTFLSPLTRTDFYGESGNLLEFSGRFKLEPMDSLNGIHA